MYGDLNSLNSVELSVIKIKELSRSKNCSVSELILAILSTALK
jgi:recombinational DNA repair protein RecR